MNRKEFLKRIGMLTVGATLIGVDAKGMQAVSALTSSAPAGDAATEPSKIDIPVKSWLIGQNST